MAWIKKQTIKGHTNLNIKRSTFRLICLRNEVSKAQNCLERKIIFDPRLKEY